MRSGVRNSNLEDDYAEEEGGANQSNRSDGKGSDSKATATRSKHSVTEQRRRRKINERFQRLRDLIPNSDQKRDTASFLLEVVDYVQYLQGEVQKYEGTYQPWSSEPTKLMPWRTSHWRTQSIPPQPLENGLGADYAAKFIDNSESLLLGHPNEFGELDALADPTGKAMDQHPDLAKSAMSIFVPVQTLPRPSQNDNLLSHQMQQPRSDAQSVDPSLAAGTGTLSRPDGLMIDGGTISISSAYSQGLLNTLTDGLQRAGVDLSQANISVQINLGKRPATADDYSNLPSTHPLPSTSVEDLDQAQKRLKTQN
ncbi:unnamed protein product [Rhodiola kirilowii]